MKKNDTNRSEVSTGLATIEQINGASDSDENSDVERAIRAMEKINDVAESVRKEVYDFYKGKLWLCLNSKPGIKGCRACLKMYIASSNYSSVCRYLQAAAVEVQLDIKHSVIPLTVLLQFYKYCDGDWQTIYKRFLERSKGAKSKKIFDQTCAELLAQKEIKMVRAKREPNSVDNLKKARELVSLMGQGELRKLSLIIKQSLKDLD
tara:strand:- start:26 stop:643 length:618 start_codon:yes stop_codon:yes gene_type:complete